MYKYKSLDKLSLKGVKETDVEIGSGAYGSVRECNYKGQRYAGKTLHQAFAMGKHYSTIAGKFEAECHRLSKLYHPNIVYFVGVYFKQQGALPSLLMELLPTSLDCALTEYPTLPTYMKNMILHDVACGLSYLHGQQEPVVHRDLTSRNVLLTDNFRAKIADFGVSRAVPSEQLGHILKLTQVPGNQLFMPPESFSDDPVYDVSLDMFSYGVLILNTVNQTWPKAKCPKANQMAVLDEVQRRVEDLDAMGKDHSLREFTEQCLRDHRLRPTAVQAVEELTKVMQSSPTRYPNSYMMLQDIDKLRGQTKQLESDNLSLKSENDSLKKTKEVSVQLKNAADERLKCLADEIELMEKMLDAKNGEVDRVGKEKLMTEQMVCRKNSRIITMEMEIAALKLLPKHKMLLLDPVVTLKWERTAPLPHPRKHLQAVELDDKLYVGAGYGSNQDVASILYYLDLQRKEWKNCPQSLTLYFSMAVFDGKVILIGGKMRVARQGEGEIEANGRPPGSSIQATGKIQHLSEDGSEWRFYNDDEMSPMPTPRMGAASVSLANNLVVAGGYAHKDRLGVVEIYDKCSKTWFRGANLPVSAAEIKTALSHGDQWYLLGGANQYRAVFTTSLKKLIRTAVVPLVPGLCEIADQEHEREAVWTSLKNVPYDFSCTSVFGGNLVVFGGEKLGMLSDSFYSDILVYDNHQQVWIHVADMPLKLSKCTAVTLSSGDLLLMGGHSNLNKPEDAVCMCSLVPTQDLVEAESDV